MNNLNEHEYQYAQRDDEKMRYDKKMRVNVEYDWYSLVEKSSLSSLLSFFVVVLF